jgi:fructose-1,6-bisphosphatase/inositol monophosphatase family enzyme
MDLVTTADKAAEELIIESLKAKFPGHAFIGEESSDGAMTAGADGELVLGDTPTWIM